MLHTTLNLPPPNWIEYVLKACTPLDITLITNIDDSLSNVIKEMNNNGYKYMKSIRIKDIFISKDKLQLNNRNVTLEICLQSMDRTLNDEDINKSIQSITTDIKKLYKLNIQEA